MVAAGLMPGKLNKGYKKVIEEEVFKSILSIAQRILDVCGRRESADSSRIIYTERDLNLGYQDGVIEIFFRGSLVFRHDPKGEITDFYEEHGVWMDEIEQVSMGIPKSSSGIANKRE
jgi:hypothetical protein